MNRSLILLLTASAAACAHPNRPTHHAADHSQASKHASHDAAATTDSYAEERALDEAPRRAGSTHNASSEGYVSPTAEVDAREHAKGGRSASSGARAENSADPVFGPTVSPDEGFAADNTAQNKAEREGDSLTPSDQGTSEADRKTTQQIRKALIADDALSFNAKNVKIITRDGHVTLRGPVNHQKERHAVEKIAGRVAGATHVDNQLQIKSN